MTIVVHHGMLQFICTISMNFSIKPTGVKLHSPMLSKVGSPFGCNFTTFSIISCIGVGRSVYTNYNTLKQMLIRVE